MRQRRHTRRRATRAGGRLAPVLVCAASLLLPGVPAARADQGDAGAARAANPAAAATPLIPVAHPAARAAAATAPTGTPGCQPGWPVVVHHPGGRVVAGATAPVACGVETGYASSESSIAVAGDGSLVYSPAESENSMVRSRDGGATWGLTYPADEQATAFWNTVDPWVIADRRTGWVFWAHATGPVRNEGGLPQGSGFYLAAAYGFQVFRSADGGRSWQTADYSSAPTGDWEKVFTGPPAPPSSGAPQPAAGYPDVVYLCANSPVEVAGPGRLCYRSLDGGTTFQIAGYNSPSAGQPQDTCPPLNFNNGVADSAGAIYIPVTCQNADYVAISHDEGATYSWVTVPHAPTGSLASGGYLQLAIDDADNLYALWPAGGQLYLAVSRDRAHTWGAPMMVSAPGLRNVARPAFAAGAAGNVGIAYYASADPSAFMLSAYVTQTRDALDADPVLYSGVANDPAHPIFHDYGLTGGSPRLDFIGGAYDRAGTTFWAGAVKQLGPNVGGQIPTTGYVAHLSFSGVPAAPPTADTTPGGAVPTGAGIPPPANPRRCVTASRLTFSINRVPGGRVVRADAYVNGRRVLSRHGRDIRRIAFARPPGARLAVRIVTTNNRGGRVVTTRTFTACSRTAVRGRTHRHRTGRRPAPRR